MDDVLRDVSASYIAESESESDDEEPLSPDPLSALPHSDTCDSLTRPVALSRGRSGSDPFSDPHSTETSPSTRRIAPPALPPRKLSSASLPPPRTRTFTLPPYLTDPELQDLTSLFPDWITSKARAASAKALEEGTVGGHGTLRIGQRPRDENFNGSSWDRFLVWLKRLFR